MYTTTEGSAEERLIPRPQGQQRTVIFQMCEYEYEINQHTDRVAFVPVVPFKDRGD